VALRFGNLCMDHKILYGTRVNKQTNKLIIRICSEDWEKANIKWKNGDDQIEYNQLRYFKFLPHESNGRLKDKVTIPNIPLIVIIAFNYKLKVFNSVVLDDPRKTVYKKVNRGSQETDPSQVYFG
jgi:hypothetical protein